MMGYTLLLVGVLLGPLGMEAEKALAEKDPADVLRTFEEDLRKAIKTAGKNKDIRAKLTKLAQQSFTQEIASASPNVPKGAWDYVNQFVDNVAKADPVFKAEEDKAERAMWFAACKAAYARELSNCKESGLAEADSPKADDVYYELTKQVASIQKRFAKDATDYDKASFDAAKQAFTFVIARSRPPQGDSKSLYTKWLIDIDKNYPMTTEDQKKQLGPINSILKAAAKSALDRAK